MFLTIFFWYSSVGSYNCYPLLEYYFCQILCLVPSQLQMHRVSPCTVTHLQVLLAVMPRWADSTLPHCRLIVNENAWSEPEGRTCWRLLLLLADCVREMAGVLKTVVAACRLRAWDGGGRGGVRDSHQWRQSDTAEVLRQAGVPAASGTEKSVLLLSLLSQKCCKSSVVNNTGLFPLWLQV